VAERLILETSFLVDFERETSRSAPGAAHGFLREREDAALFVSVVTTGELAAGASLATRGTWEEFLAPFQVLAIDRESAWEYGRAYRYLQANGLLIGANDLWIAAAALAHELPVVTRNPAHFGRVPGLEVLAYRG
jgi:tRNA(fMet)-specific endonuclease VapC